VVKQGYVTKQGHIIKNKCQFSWFCDGKTDKPRDLDAYRWALHVSLMVLYGVTSDPTGGALYYHSTAVNPKWNLRKQPLEIIGDHIFYK
jgi:spore germination cell wall hydrolase CwlJ-like protein